MSKIKHYSRWIVGSALLISALGLGALGIAGASRDAGWDAGYESRGAHSEDHDSDDDDSDGRGGEHDSALAAAAPGNALYTDECGSCHVAYPPGLLPSASWKAIMTGLDNHFGDNAELPTDITASLTAFLESNASDRGDRLRNARLLRDVNGDPPVRITGLPYFKREHDEIPRRMVEDNPGVGSFGNCDSCHQDAARGRFDEDTVSIRGFGRWDD